MLSSRKFFVAALVVLALFTLSANATVSRLEGLGGAPDDYWFNLPGNIFVLHDAATPGIWPQLVQQYPKQAGGEFSSASGAWDLDKVYANYSWKENRTALQFSLTKLGSTRYFNTAFPDPADREAPSRLNLTYGRVLGDDWLLGVDLSYFGQSYETKDNPATPDTIANEAEKVSTSVIGLKVGVSNTGDYKWDAVIGLELPSFTDEAAGLKVSENDGSMGIQFAGRYWWDYYEKCALIPNVRFANYKDGSKFYAAPGDPKPTYSITSTQIAVGVGHNWYPVDNALVLFDVGVKIGTKKYEVKNNPPIPAAPDSNYDDKTNALPYWRLGIETAIFSWLDGRLGAERDWQTHDLTGKNYPTEPKTSNSITTTYLGATAHWNRMILDLVVHPDFIKNGPNFVSGQTSTMFTRVSLKYVFGN